MDISTKIIRSDIFDREGQKALVRTVAKLEKEKLSTMGYENFIERHLDTLFKALHVKVPPQISYTIQFIDTYQSIVVSCNGFTWRILNKSNNILYYANDDTFSLYPIVISLKIFLDIASIMGLSEVPLEVTTSLQ